MVERFSWSISRCFRKPEFAIYLFSSMSADEIESWQHTAQELVEECGPECPSNCEVRQLASADPQQVYRFLQQGGIDPALPSP